MEEQLREGTNPCTVIYSSGYVILESSIMISDAEFNIVLDYLEEKKCGLHQEKIT